MIVNYSELASTPFVDDVALNSLLDEAFPDTFEGRIFFKQEPHSRIIAYSGNQVIGQVGIDRRVINIQGAIVKIIGVIDLCVLPSHRGLGIGTALLEKVERHSVDRDFVVLMADDDSLYRKSGFSKLHTAPTKWLAIEGLKSHSIIERDLSDCFMYKPLTSKKWPSGEIDLLGYLF